MVGKLLEQATTSIITDLGNGKINCHFRLFYDSFSALQLVSILVQVKVLAVMQSSFRNSIHSKVNTHVTGKLHYSRIHFLAVKNL